MAIISVDGPQKISGNAKGETHRYIVVSDLATENSRTVRAASGIPRDGTLLAGTTWLSKSEARRTDDPFVWEVEVRYESGIGKELPPEQPTDERWNVSFSSRSIPYERPVTKDKEGRKIANTAGRPFHPPPTVPHYDEEIEIDFNTSDPTFYSTIRACIGKVNSDAISFSLRGVPFSFDIGTLRLVKYSFTVDYDYTTDSYTAFRVSLTLHRRIGDEWHDLELRNEGYCRADGTPFLDAHGNVRTEPTLLNATGTDELGPSETAEPLRFDVLARVPFATLLDLA